MTNTKEKIEIMQAFLDGATIQVKQDRSEVWNDLPGDFCEPIWDWQSSSYRIKPEPLEYWAWFKPSNPKAATYIHLSKESAENRTWPGRQNEGWTLLHLREVEE